MMKLLLLLLVVTSTHASVEEQLVEHYLSIGLKDLQKAAAGDAPLAQKILEDKFPGSPLSHFFEPPFPVVTQETKNKLYVHLTKILLRTEVEGIRHFADYHNELNTLIQKCGPLSVKSCQSLQKCQSLAAANLIAFMRTPPSEEDRNGFSRELTLNELTIDNFTISKAYRYMSTNFAFRGLNYFSPTYKKMTLSNSSNGLNIEKYELSGVSDFPAGVQTLRSLKCSIRKKKVDCDLLVGDSQKDCGPKKDKAVLNLPWVNNTERSFGPKLDSVSDGWSFDSLRASQGKAE